MSKNDLVVLDSILKKQFDSVSDRADYYEYFELFCLNQILKDYDMSVDDIESGWVDGGDDGGIDGFYTIVDGRSVASIDDLNEVRKNPLVELVIVTCKHADKFTQIAVNNIISSVGELLDLSIENDDLTGIYNDDVLSSRKSFVDSYISIADKNPTLKISYYFASRGDTDQIAPNVQKRSEHLTNLTTKMFTGVDCSFTYIGGAELLTLHRKKKDFSLRMTYIESTISRTNDSYIALCRLDDFNKSISDEKSKLRRYLFESNVRDYMNNSVVNNEIKNTLENKGSNHNVDFWLLNNGVTILASNASVVGKEISLENVQIVNGLQTTETIYNYFQQTKRRTDDRAVLVKIIVANDENLRDRIIKATNNQNKINLASLKATDKLQKDIEQLLLSADWYYDRRKNYYKNQEKPIEKIITVEYMAQCLVGLCLYQIEKATKQHPYPLSNDDSYKKVFNDRLDIRVYLAIITIRKKIELIVKDIKTINGLSLSDRRNGVVVAYVYAALKLNQVEYDPNKLIDIMNDKVTEEDVKAIEDVFNGAATKYLEEQGVNAIRRPQRNNVFVQTLRSELHSAVRK